MKILGLHDSLDMWGFTGKVIDISRWGVTIEGRGGVKRVYTLKDVESCLLK